jgi:16S rRNA G966 N2-methylase RsmD
MIHQYAKYFNANAITCEHDKNWVEFFTNSKDGDYPVNVQLMNLRTIQYKGYDTLTYEDCSNVFSNQRFDLVLVDGPFGSSHFSRSQIIDLAKSNLSQHFCIIIDDFERPGEQETMEEVQNILKTNNTPFCRRVYSAEKQHMLICSPNLEFLTTM